MDFLGFNLFEEMEEMKEEIDTFLNNDDEQNIEDNQNDIGYFNQEDNSGEDTLTEENQTDSWDLNSTQDDLDDQNIFDSSDTGDDVSFGGFYNADGTYHWSSTI